MKIRIDLWAGILAVAIVYPAIGCARNSDDDEDDGDDIVTPRSDATCPQFPIERPPDGRMFGIDTNQSTVGVANALDQDIKWIGRYIVTNQCRPSDGPKCKNKKPVQNPVEAGEIEQWRMNGVHVALLWELHDRFRACSANSAKAEKQRGRDDGAAARIRMDLLNAPKLTTAVYFTVDFDVSSNQWNKKLTNNDCIRHGAPKHVSTRVMIENYFDGINETLREYPVGVYGSFGTVQGILNDPKATATYAWQQTFRGDASDPKDPNDPRFQTDPRATIRQYDIFPCQTGWLPVDDEGGGALDFDSAQNFSGMWPP